MYEAIAGSEIIICDLTGQRPNVYVEAGYALKHHEQNRLIYLFEPQDSGDRVPFDLNTFKYVQISERKFYQKITDIYATALDYDPSATATKRFFAAVQNKMHYAIHGNTAAEVIVDRADHQKETMGLTSWEGAPKGKIHKYDVSIAKDYLSKFELGQMQRVVSAYLDMAEVQAMRKIPMTMADWEERSGRVPETLG